MSRTIKILFTLSVVLNFVLLGLAAGYLMRDMHSGPWEEASKELSPESREMVSTMFEKMHVDAKPIMDEMKEARQDLKKVMMTEEFNEKEYDRCINRMRDLRQKMGEKFAATTKDVVVSLPPMERQRMAEKFLSGFDWKNARGSRWNCDESFGPRWYGKSSF